MDYHPRQALMAAARAHCAAKGVSLAKLGEEVMRDRGFFKRVEEGGGFTVTSYNRVMVHLGHTLPPPDGTATEAA